MEVDYSPTGREFVAGSYDRSVRIFAYQGGHSREVGAPICWRAAAQRCCAVNEVTACCSKHTGSRT